MPIRKFRDVSEMEDTLWYEPGTPALFAAIARLWEFSRRTCPQHFPPGVYKHRSIADADALREQWEAANFERSRRAARNLARRADRDGHREPFPELPLEASKAKNGFAGRKAFV